MIDFTLPGWQSFTAGHHRGSVLLLTDVDHALGGVEQVTGGVLVAAVSAAADAQHHRRWIATDRAEEAEGGQIGDPFTADGGDPADGAGDHRGDHQQVSFLAIELVWIETEV